jgi:uncharacterized protein YidB (DUF937 family)
MASLEDTIRTAVPGGNVGKPLMLALIGLLASGALFKSGAGRSSTGAAQPAPAEGGGGLLGGLGGLLGKLEQGGLANIANSWIGTGENQPVSPGQLGPALGPDILKSLAQKTGLPEEELTKQLSQVLPGVVDKLTPAGRLPTLAELSQMK